MTRKVQILVIGHHNSATLEHEKLAYQVGAEIAKAGAVLISGGGNGVMKSSCQGAQEAGGITVGIILEDSHEFANDFCDIVIPSGMGLARHFLNALSSDGVIIIGGGAGTLSEACAAYMYKRPMVAIRNTKGVAQKYADKFLDFHKIVKIVSVDSPRDAVKLILRTIKSSCIDDDILLPK